MRDGGDGKVGVGGEGECGWEGVRRGWGWAEGGRVPTGFILTGGAGVGGVFTAEGTGVAGEVVSGIWTAGGHVHGAGHPEALLLVGLSMLEKRNRWPHTSHG